MLGFSYALDSKEAKAVLKSINSHLKNFDVSDLALVSKLTAQKFLVQKATKGYWTGRLLKGINVANTNKSFTLFATAVDDNGFDYASTVEYGHGLITPKHYTAHAYKGDSHLQRTYPRTPTGAASLLADVKQLKARGYKVGAANTLMKNLANNKSSKVYLKFKAKDGKVIYAEEVAPTKGIYFMKNTRDWLRKDLGLYAKRRIDVMVGSKGQLSGLGVAYGLQP